MAYIKCLYKDNPHVVMKEGYIMELECDCRNIPVGFYNGVDKYGEDCWVSTDIETGLAIVRAKALDRCIEDTKALLMFKGIKSFRNMQKQAKKEFEEIYKGEEWNCEEQVDGLK